MPEIISKYDIDKDWKNRWRAANKFTNSNWVQRMPQKDQEMVAKLKGLDEEQAKIIITPYLEDKYQLNKEKMDDVVEKMTEYLNEQKAELFEAMEKLTRHSIDYKLFTIYLTTLNRYPYSWQEWAIWMVDTSNPKFRKRNRTGIFAHELLHMQTHKYYENVEPMSKLSRKQFNDLKESLTFLLNHEFKGIDMREDTWYEDHQKLRKALEEYRLKSDKNFDDLIAFGCDYMIKNNL